MALAEKTKLLKKIKMVYILYKLLFVYVITEMSFGKQNYRSYLLFDFAKI